MTFGEKLRRVREENNLTQEQLGEKLYVSRQVVSKWETGVRYPDLLTAKRIAEIFNLSVDYFLNEDSLHDYSEKQPIIEDKKTNIIISALYAIIASLSFVKFVDDVFSLGLIIKNREFAIEFNSIFMLVIPMIFCLIALVISTFSFVKCIKGDINPKLAGILGISYSVCICLREIVVVSSMGFIAEYAISIALVVAFAIIMYLYFIKNVGLFYKPVIVSCIIFGGYFIVNTIYSIIFILNNAENLSNNAVNVVAMPLYLAFIAIIVVQAYYLERKRKLNK